MNLKVIDNNGTLIGSYTEELFIPSVRPQVLSHASKISNRLGGEDISLILEVTPGEKNAQLYYVTSDGVLNPKFSGSVPIAALGDLSVVRESQKIRNPNEVLPQEAVQNVPEQLNTKSSISFKNNNIFMTYKGNAFTSPPVFVGTLANTLSTAAIKQLADFIIVSMQELLGDRPYELKEVEFSPLVQNVLVHVSNIIEEPLVAESGTPEEILEKQASTPTEWEMEKGRIFYTLDYKNVLQQNPEKLSENVVLNIQPGSVNVVSILLKIDYPELINGTIQDLNNIIIPVGFELKEFEETESGIPTKGSKHFSNENEFVFTAENGGIDLDFIMNQIKIKNIQFNEQDASAATENQNVEERAPRPETKPLTEEELNQIAALVREKSKSKEIDREKFPKV